MTSAFEPVPVGATRGHEPRTSARARAGGLRIGFMLLCATSLFAASTSASAVMYAFTDLGAPLGGTYSSASGINNFGQVVGTSTIAAGDGHATLWHGNSATELSRGYSGAYGINSSGQVVGTALTSGGGGYHATLWNGTTQTDLGALGINGSFALAINDSGLVVGYSGTAANFERTHATLWNGTTVIDLGTLGGTSSVAGGINNSGQVVGYAYTAGDAAYHATLWNGTTKTDLGTLGGKNSGARGINNSGQVVGQADLAVGIAAHATLWNGTSATDLGTLGGTWSTAYAINNSGQVVGNSYIAGDADVHATLWNGATATDLNSYLDPAIVSADWILGVANGINDNGWITGDAMNSLTGEHHAFLLSVSAVPLPSTYALMLGGVATFGFFARRRSPMFVAAQTRA